MKSRGWRDMRGTERARHGLVVRISSLIFGFGLAFTVSAASFANGCAWYDAPCRAKAEQTQLVPYLAKAFNRGASFYSRTLGGWFRGLAGRAAGKAGFVVLDGQCDVDVKCAPGLSCLNVCVDDYCDAFEKRCRKGPTKVLIQSLYAPCGPGDVCAKGTECLRTCREGVVCPITHRCLSQDSGGHACRSASDCAAFCGSKTFPPIGEASMRVACQANQCICRLQEADYGLEPIVCPSELSERVICQAGTLASCTTGGCALGADCQPRQTCLRAPEFGGYCLDEAACGTVTCAAGASPFCDTDRKCRCRTVQTEAVACESDLQCEGVLCASGERPACNAGSCACAAEELKETACTDPSLCVGDCPEGYGHACVDGRCACQRTVESGPVACADVADCAGITCPEGFGKDCLNDQCVCTRTREQ